jgi:hypothetical protein
MTDEIGMKKQIKKWGRRNHPVISSSQKKAPKI